MRILAIDPGNVQSAYVLFDTEKEECLSRGILLNDECLKVFDTFGYSDTDRADICVIEQIASMGMAVGETIFETAVWSGRFWQLLSMRNIPVERLKRIAIKNILCGSSKAKDTNIRQRLIDIFGEVGTKKNPGKLYGMKADMWAALAVAVAWNMKQTKDFKY
jgi:hypothetical protein